MHKPKQHNRREFLKKGLSTGVALGGAFLLGGPGRLFAGASTPGAPPDLAAVKNGEAGAMFNQGIRMMGGMKQFVKKGQTVVVKPNMGFNYAPEFGATTNPALIKTIVDHCLGAGAKKVYVFDHVASSSQGMAPQCYKNSGVEDAARDAGAIVAPAHAEKYYQNVVVPGAKILQGAKVHELILESDVLINVPILKSHGYTHMTMAMKNLMGIVWDRMVYHFSDLDQCIADFCLYKKPDLNVVDAYRVLMRNGPRGSTLENVAIMKTLLISRDIVAVDAAAAKVFGKAPETLRYLTLGHEMGLGNMNLNELNIQRHVMAG